MLPKWHSFIMKQYIGAVNHLAPMYWLVQDAKFKYWCCMISTFHRPLAIFHQFNGAANTWSLLAKVLVFWTGKVQPCLQHIAYQYSWREGKRKYVFFKIAANLKIKIIAFPTVLDPITKHLRPSLPPYFIISHYVPFTSRSTDLYWIS